MRCKCEIDGDVGSFMERKRDIVASALHMTASFIHFLHCMDEFILHESKICWVLQSDQADLLLWPRPAG